MAKPTKRASLRQIAALPWRREADGSLRVLLVTSRERGRWILPKGWPIKGLRNAEAAETEAMEEAGVVGRISRKPIGRFQYAKTLPKRTETVKVDVYALEVERQLDDWLEKGQRELQWFRPEDAAATAADGSAGAVILAFARSLAAASVAEQPEPMPEPAPAS